jgi:hypothetical protein
MKHNDFNQKIPFGIVTPDKDQENYLTLYESLDLGQHNDDICYQKYQSKPNVEDIKEIANWVANQPHYTPKYKENKILPPTK